MNDDVTFSSATELARRIASRELSPLEAVNAFLERIELWNPRLNAYLTVTGESARKAAIQLEESLDRSQDRGPLWGVPYSLKDLNMAEGVRCTFGSRLTENFVAPFDENFVARLRRAGMILIGKTNTPEFGTRMTTDNDLGPPTRNPWSLDRTAGGSSGGAAAAVAAGLCPLAVGSDGGGSIRIPAAWCGVVGLKPSRGRVSMAPALGETYAGMAVNGPITRTVEDAALMLDLISGYETGDPYWAPPAEISFSSATKLRPTGLRLALCTDITHAETHPQVREIVQRAAIRFEEMGHVVEEASPPLDGFGDTFELLFKVSAAGLPVEELSGNTVDETQFTDWVQWLRSQGRTVRANDYVKALSHMHLYSRSIVQFFENYDALLTPTMLQPAQPLEQKTMPFPELFRELREHWIPFTYPFNATGQPAISVPAGWTNEGLPIGLQIVGRPAAETTILALASQFEEVAPWVSRRPPQ